MKELFQSWPILAAAVYSSLGLVLFMVSFWLIEKVTPGNLWKQIIEEKNLAAGVIVAASLIGISIIIASSIVG